MYLEDALQNTNETLWGLKKAMTYIVELKEKDEEEELIKELEPLIKSAKAIQIYLQLKINKK